MLEAIQTSSYNLITSSKFWIILLSVLLFIGVSVYVYNKYVSSMVNPTFVANQEFASSTDTNINVPEVEIMIFVVDWCPHSKKALPIWEELKKKHNGSIYNGYKLTFVEVNGEENPEMADKYKVDGYPTIKLLKGNQVIEYDAKPTIEHLTEFLNSTLA
jgi:thiol-disulfide isomerase/thioredoxin